MKNTLLIAFLLYISSLWAQEQYKEPKFYGEVTQNIFYGRHLFVSETGLYYIYRLKPHVNFKLGGSYGIDLEEKSMNINYVLGVGYQLGLSDCFCGNQKLELFALTSTSSSNFLLKNNIDIGAKVILKKMISFSIAMRYNREEWSDPFNVHGITRSFGVSAGFGIILDFEKCPRKSFQ